MIDREALYQMLADKSWDRIAKVLARHASVLSSDPVAKQAIAIFETEFFYDLTGKTDQGILDLLEYPHIVAQLNPSAFSNEFSEQLIEEKIERLENVGRRDTALNLALQNPSLTAAKELVGAIEEASPERLADAKRSSSRITATEVRDESSAARRLFRSRQEENFFEAMRSAFPTYNPYPNVALNAVIEFDTIKNRLSETERSFFFRALVDSVVFDPATGYMPLYFFELDSHYHDTPEQSRRDDMKNRIFEAANIKLYRIRASDEDSSSMTEFRELITEIVRGL